MTISAPMIWLRSCVRWCRPRIPRGEGGGPQHHRSKRHLVIAEARCSGVVPENA